MRPGRNIRAKGQRLAIAKAVAECDAAWRARWNNAEEEAAKDLDEVKERLRWAERERNMLIEILHHQEDIPER